MEKIFDITKFGAVGDGISDSTEAIQKALDEASTCMGSVIVPPGKYMVSNLRMYGQGVSLVGTSESSFIGINITAARRRIPLR